ncbi:phosphotransferase family protein [Singulisphaera acidiphila]|nr:aminoglycoside phosphotransferase family protein [Singulisphaera acidiphila]
MTNSEMATDDAGGHLDLTELPIVLAEVLQQSLGRPVRMEQLSTRPSPNWTSSFLLEIDAVIEGGETLRLLLKSSSRSDLHETARRVKPSFLHDPRREPAVYRELLDAANLGTAKYYGESLRRCWLFLERVPGVALFQIGDLSAWREAAQWLARLHLGFAGEDAPRSQTVPLLCYDAHHFCTWLERARTFQGERARGPIWDRLEQGFLNALDRLSAMSTTLIHGEFYASNVLIETKQNSRRVCAVDWETAGIGPGLIDLAALTSGSWPAEDRFKMAESYRMALAGSAPLPDQFSADLDACRLLLAVKWLGWSADWSPPADQRQDWLGEAVALADAMVPKAGGRK